MYYSNFFSQLTGFPPYSFQNEVFEKYSLGENIILQAPTGSGKTWAALGPFIYHWKEWKQGKQQGDNYPRKLIYSLPLRILANSLLKK